jgi:hypothetical protein
LAQSGVSASLRAIVNRTKPLREACLLKKSIIAGVSMLALATSAFAADQGMRPMFKSGINRHDPVPGVKPLGGLTTFVLKWTYQSKSYNATFVGANPKTGTSTTVPVYIIPMKLTYGSMTTDPTAADYTGKSPVTNTVNSPIFGVLDYTQNGTDLGTTQYEDAFERDVLWGKVQKHTGYHVLLGTPTIEPVQAYTVPKADGGTTSFDNITVLTADINWFDTQIEGLLKTLAIPANSLPIFLTTQTYLTSGRLLHWRVPFVYRHTGLFACHLYQQPGLHGDVRAGRGGTEPRNWRVDGRSADQQHACAVGLRHL